MKCKMCGSELGFAASECKYCGCRINNPFIVDEKKPQENHMTELDTPGTEFVRRKENIYNSICKYCGRDLNPVTGICDYCNEQIGKEIETEEYIKETDMSRRKTDTKGNTGRKSNGRKKKKKANPILTAFGIIVLMIILFAVSFTVFFRMLGGSFIPKEEAEIVTPSPKPTAQVTRVVQTPQPTEEPTKKPKATEKAKPEKTDEPEEEKSTEEAETETKKPENTPIADGKVIMAERNAYAYPSDEQIITESELEEMSRQEVKIVLQEIYARHGYTFNEDDLIEYFEGKDWYMPVETDIAEVEESFNSTEMKNKEIIEEYQKKMGWRI